MKHLLTKARKEDILLDPFPHLVIKNAISDKLCLQLISEFPSKEAFSRGVEKGELTHLNNQTTFYQSIDLLNNKKVSPLWKKFIQAHLSRDFFNKMIYLFDNYISLTYPYYEKRFGSIRKMRLGLEIQIVLIKRMY